LPGGCKPTPTDEEERKTRNQSQAKNAADHTSSNGASV
jgi:hypothetical protein